VTDDLALDFSHAGMTPTAEAYAPTPIADPWLTRRRLTFGASDAAALMIAVGRRPAADFPRWVQDAARPIAPWKQPRLFVEKAGLVGPLKRSRPSELGLERERELVRTWSALVARGVAGPDAELIDPASIVYVPDVIPQELLPFVNRYATALSCSPDMLVRNVLGVLGVADAKCNTDDYAERYGGAPPHYGLQLQVQMDTCAGEFGLVIEGSGWGAEWRDHDDGSPCGPVRTWPVEKDDAVIAELREAGEEGAERVCALREEARAA